MNLLLPGMEILFLLIGLVVFVLPIVFYLITVQNTLRIISPENRKMSPGQVWWILIPVFGYFWLFKIVEAISESTRTELAGYGIAQRDTMKTAGLSWGIFIIAGSFFGFLLLIAFSSFAWHWIKVAEARKLILSVHEIAQQTDESSIFK